MSLFERYDFYLIAALSAFYLIVFSTYLSFLFTCNVDNAIKNNQKLIIVMGYFLFFYLVTLSNKTLIDDHPIENMLITLVYYIIFLFTTRMDIKIKLAILIIFLINFMEINKDHYRLLLEHKTNDEKIYWITLHKPISLNLFEVKESQLRFINDIQHILNYGFYLLIAIGFLSFYGEIKYLKGNKNISIVKLFFDRNICDLRNNRSIYQNVLHAINIK
jgi:hypothetical protein